MAIPGELDPAFDAAGERYNVDPNLLRAVALQESHGDPNPPRGEAGEIGIMQFLPATAAQFGIDPSDPLQAINGAAQYLRQNLDEGQALKARGANVDPVVYAVRRYNGSADNPATATYAQNVAGHYSRLTGSPTPSAAAVASPAAPSSGGLAPDLVQLAQSGGATPPAGPGSAAGTGAVPAPSAISSPTQPIYNPATGGFEQRQRPPAVAPQSAAGAAGPAGSGDTLLQDYFSGAIAPAAPAPSTAPAPSPPAGPGPAAAGTPAVSVQGLVDTYNRYRGFPAGIGLATQALGMLQKMAPEGYAVMTDGSLQLRPGYAAGAAQMKGAEAAAEEQQKRITAAVAPQRLRAGEGVVFPPGSPLAGQPQGPAGPGGALPAGAAGGATAEGATGPGSLVPTPGGGAMIPGTAPPQATETFYKGFDDLRKEADAARSGLYQADLLKDALHQIGTTGPLTEHLGQLASVFQQFGVPPSTIASIGLPKAATVAEADKLSQDLLGEVLKTQFPGRITNADMVAFKNTVARSTTPLEANDFLIDRVLRPKLQRDIDRYGAIAGLPEQDPTLASLPGKLYGWDQNPEHSYQSYVTRAQKGAAVPGVPPGATGGAAPQAPSAASPPGATLRYDPVSKTIIPVVPVR